MKECKIKGILYDENHVLMEWQEPCGVQMPEMIDAIKHIKDNINNYLTDLVNADKVHNVKDELDYFEDNEEEQEEIEAGRVSGNIEGITAISEKYNRNMKRKINYSGQEKKFKN